MDSLRILIILYTDSRSLYNAVVIINSTNKKRLMIDIMSLREVYKQREIAEVCWIDRQNNPANAFTKAKSNRALEKFITTNEIIIYIKAKVDRPGQGV